MKSTRQKKRIVEPHPYDEMTITRAARHVRGISRETASEIVEKHVAYVPIAAQGGKTSKRFTWGQFLEGLRKWRDNNPYRSRRISV
jgi:hypothetical protein